MFNKLQKEILEVLSQEEAPVRTFELWKKLKARNKNSWENLFSDEAMNAMSFWKFMSITFLFPESPSLGSVYIALDKLEDILILRSWHEEIEVRGEKRPARFVELEPEAKQLFFRLFVESTVEAVKNELDSCENTT